MYGEEVVRVAETSIRERCCETSIKGGCRFSYWSHILGPPKLSVKGLLAGHRGPLCVQADQQRRIILFTIFVPKILD